jgi:NDP-sugar pyrophosphorylase family protein
MKAVILAGGLGTRLRPFTEVIPKPLLPLGEKSVTEVQIQRLRDAGCTDIYLATNYMSDYVEAFLGDGARHGVRLHYSREEKPLGTCGPLSLLREQLDEPFLVTNGDILSKVDFARLYRHAASEPSLLTVATKIISTPFRFGNVQVDDQNHIIGVEEKPEFNLEILAGIYCMKPGVFRFIPNDTYYGVDKLIKDMLAQKELISRYLIEEYWLDIGQVEDYSKAREEYERHFAAESPR